jgi:hypothetical protein
VLAQCADVVDLTYFLLQFAGPAIEKMSSFENRSKNLNKINDLQRLILRFSVIPCSSYPGLHLPC